MSDLDIDITLDDGKYRYTFDNKGHAKAYRYGEPWRDVVGDGLVLAMAYHIAELETNLANVKQLLAESCEDDTAIRKLAEPYTDVEGDSYGVPTIVDVVEALVDKLAAANRLADELDNMATQHGCECGHPQCNKCGDTRDAREALAAKLKEQL